MSLVEEHFIDIWTFENIGTNVVLNGVSTCYLFTVESRLLKRILTMYRDGVASLRY